MLSLSVSLRLSLNNIRYVELPDFLNQISFFLKLVGFGLLLFQIHQKSFDKLPYLSSITGLAGKIRIKGRGIMTAIRHSGFLLWRQWESASDFEKQSDTVLFCFKKTSPTGWWIRVSLIHSCMQILWELPPTQRGWRKKDANFKTNSFSHMSESSFPL